MPEASPDTEPTRRTGVLVAVAAAVVIVDQLTKSWALDALANGRRIHVAWTLELALSFNTGAAFGIGRGLTPFLIVAALVLLVVLIGVGRTVVGLPGAIAIGMVLGGSVGNLVDRLVRSHGGAVIDFIDLGWWPVFNVADMGISIGAVLLVLFSIERR